MWRGMYRDDGFLVFKGRRSISEIQILRDKSQEKADKIVGNDYLQYTYDTWNPGGRLPRNKQNHFNGNR